MTDEHYKRAIWCMCRFKGELFGFIIGFFTVLIKRDDYIHDIAV